MLHIFKKLQVQSWFKAKFTMKNPLDWALTNYPFYRIVNFI